MLRYDELVSPGGYSGSLKELMDANRRKLMADFIACFRLIEEESPKLIAETGFDGYYHQLSQLSGSTVAWLFHLPTTTFWTDVMRQLIMRRTHRSMPSGHPIAHLRDFGRFVLAGHIYEGRDVDINLRLDRNGHLHLPGIRGILVCPEDLALTEITTRIHDGTMILLAKDGRSANLEITQVLRPDKSGNARTLLHLNDGFGFRFLPVASGLFEINNCDAYLRLPERVSYEFEQIDNPLENRWVTSIDNAWNLILETDTALADEIANIVNVVVPVVSAETDVHLSSSFSELAGGIYLSWTSDNLVLAEAIVHEYYHVKLNAILEIDPLIMGGTNEAIFYSPWREDPRPISGLLQAIYAFVGVTHFWLSYYERMKGVLEGSEEEWISMNIVKSVLQLEYSIESIGKHTAYTEGGRQIADGLEKEIRRMSLARPRLSCALQARVEDTVRSHYEKWQSRYNSSDRTSSYERLGVTELSTSDDESEWVFGCIGGILPNKANESILTDRDMKIIQAADEVLGHDTVFTVNRLEEGVHHKDQLMDDLFTLHEEDKQAYENLRSYSVALTRMKSAFSTYLQSLFHYIDGEHLRSAEGLLDVITCYPDNVDTWKYLSLALRHCGYDEASKAILFNLPTCITLMRDSLSRRDLQSYEGIKCLRCGQVALTESQVGVFNCLECGENSLEKVRCSVPVSFHVGVTTILKELEQLNGGRGSDGFPKN